MITIEDIKDYKRVTIPDCEYEDSIYPGHKGFDNTVIVTRYEHDFEKQIRIIDYKEKE